MDEQKPILLRVWPKGRDHAGYFVIKALLQAKTRAGTSSEPLPNNNPDRKSWQTIHRFLYEKQRDLKVQELLDSGEYKLEDE